MAKLIVDGIRCFEIESDKDKELVIKGASDIIIKTTDASGNLQERMRIPANTDDFSLSLSKLTMRGDIELGEYKLKTINLLIKEEDSQFLVVRNVGDTAYKGIKLYDIWVKNRLLIDNTKYIRSSGVSATNYYTIQSGNGSVFVDNLKLIGGYVEIYQGKFTSDFDANAYWINRLKGLDSLSGDNTFYIDASRSAAYAGDALLIRSKNASDVKVNRIVVTGGVDTADIKIVNAHLIPDMANGGAIGIESYVSDYGGGFANFTPPTGFEGRIIVAIDTNATTPGKRLYVYANGTWNYVDLS